MAAVVPLGCARCGGPLGRLEALPALVECVYCGAAMSVSAERSVVANPVEVAWEAQQQRRKAFLEALVASLEAGVPPFEAVRDAGAAHLGLGDRAESAARVAMGLVRDFERQEKVEAATQPLVLARIVEAYLRALHDLRTADATEINLPFLTADGTGPKHLLRTVDARLFQALAAAPPAPAPPAPARETSRPAPGAKRWWWPFGG